MVLTLAMAPARPRGYGSTMAEPWLEDACALVDAMRAKQITPGEAVEASLAAIEASDLNAFSHVDADGAREAAAKADPTLPFGGLPMAIKELDPVAGWPYTEGSLVFADRIGAKDATIVERLRQAGAVATGHRCSLLRSRRPEAHLRSRATRPRDLHRATHLRLRLDGALGA